MLDLLHFDAHSQAREWCRTVSQTAKNASRHRKDEPSFPLLSNMLQLGHEKKAYSKSLLRHGRSFGLRPF